ncbi:30S ribosomal protein S11 [Deinococcus roseus]|uniref:Small ribosomal subunit protein uS11 n=1 Tax=Deinococcus roseus TaxID=392414 RepID=A0ABQ2DAU4_9DEIO|nr:30S ribosomal protein S11 [Deinococcus roseus]GGJ50715.1 30S ribosomal protein S11 [Deinococcus roseus]
MAKAKTTRTKRTRRNIPHGRAYIHASYNNTIVTITDMDGNSLAWSSGGTIGYKGSKKGTPYAAQLAAADAVKKAQSTFNMSQVEVVVRGTGSGREQAIRAIQASGIDVKSIMDDSPVPHNGCRLPKKKRM